MVHPDFDENGRLVDLVYEEDDLPTGQVLPKLSETTDVKLTGYGDL